MYIHIHKFIYTYINILYMYSYIYTSTYEYIHTCVRVLFDYCCLLLCVFLATLHMTPRARDESLNM